MVAITGPSGSCKSTIISLIAGIDRPPSARSFAAMSRHSA
jgi:ABC-type lipoprotein export system ATPase subunit